MDYAHFTFMRKITDDYGNLLSIPLDVFDPFVLGTGAPYTEVYYHTADNLITLCIDKHNGMCNVSSFSGFDTIATLKAIRTNSNTRDKTNERSKDSNRNPRPNGYSYPIFDYKTRW